jgi:hypothetical protein
MLSVPLLPCCCPCLLHSIELPAAIQTPGAAPAPQGAGAAGGSSALPLGLPRAHGARPQATTQQRPAAAALHLARQGVMPGHAPLPPCCCCWVAGPAPGTLPAPPLPPLLPANLAPLLGGAVAVGWWVLCIFLGRAAEAGGLSVSCFFVLAQPWMQQQGGGPCYHKSHRRDFLCKSTGWGGERAEGERPRAARGAAMAPAARFWKGKELFLLLQRFGGLGLCSRTLADCKGAIEGRHALLDVRVDIATLAAGLYGFARQATLPDASGLYLEASNSGARNVAAAWQRLQRRRRRGRQRARWCACCAWQASPSCASCSWRRRSSGAGPSCQAACL